MEIWALNVLEISRDNLNGYKTLVICMYYLMDFKFYRYIFLISWKTKNKYKSIPSLQLNDKGRLQLKRRMKFENNDKERCGCIDRKTKGRRDFFFFWEEWSAGVWRHDPRVLKMTLIPNLNKFDFDINNSQNPLNVIFTVFI